MVGRSLSACVAGLAVSATAAYADVSMKFEPGVALPLSAPQSELYDVGTGQSVKLLLGLSPYLDIGPSASFLFLPAVAPTTESGVAWGVGGGLRLKRPHDQPSSGVSPWLDADAMYIRTGELDRFGFDVAAGLAFPIGEAKAVWAGPFVRYQQIVAPDRRGYDTRDAKILLAGLSFEFGSSVKRPPPPPAPVPAPVEIRIVEPAPPPQIITKTVESCPDGDADTVPDTIDQCPTVAGPLTSAGCPPVPKVVITKDRLELKEKVFFAWNRAEISGESFSILDEVALVMKDNPTLRVRIEGHTDISGNAKHNLKLSQRRAASVVNYLAKRGITRGRLASKGFGPAVPLDVNDTAEGRERNRRVEFVIVSITPSEGSSK